MKILFLPGFIFLAFTECAAQKCDCKHLVIYKNIVSIDHFNVPSSHYKFKNNIYYSYLINDCFGSMEFTQIDTNGIVREEGVLIGNKKLLKEKIYQYDINLNITDSSFVKVYMPTKNGLWKYYSDKGDLIKIVFYIDDTIIWTKSN